MKKKLALAFAGVLLMLTASFAPIAQAQFVPFASYVTMGGKMDGRAYMYAGAVGPNSRLGVSLPMPIPFLSRLPFLKPFHLFQDIYFDPVDLDLDGVPDIISITKIQVNPIIHTTFIAFRGQWWKFTFLAVDAGQGVIFLNPMMPGDVDVITFNNDTGVYWGSDGVQSSPLAGKFAAASGGYFNLTGGNFVPGMQARFPSPGADGIPGTSLWADPTDGFGDGVPDPKGSSILMIPMIVLGEEWNASIPGWQQQFFAPMPMVLTTGKAYDIVAEPGSLLYGNLSTEHGEPWEWTASCASWDDPKAFVKVTYVAAWSNMLYCINPDDDNDGVPDAEPGTGWWYTVDFFWEYEEQKVRDDVVIADINCDKVVNIKDVGIVEKAFGARDEGVGPDLTPGTADADDLIYADPNYDARADTDCNGLIDIFDLVRIEIDFGKALDP